MALIWPYGACSQTLQPSSHHAHEMALPLVGFDLMPATKHVVTMMASLEGPCRSFDADCIGAWWKALQAPMRLGIRHQCCAMCLHENSL